jgi:hypothetical protein
MLRTVRGVLLCSALGVCASSVCATSVSAQSFEGVVTVRLASRGGQPQEIEYLARNGNVRISLPTPAGPAAMIALGAEQKMYMVLDSQRAYMEIPTGDIAATAAKAPGVSVTRTGRKETIAGYECEHVTVETTGASGVQRTDACIAASLGRFISPMGGVGGATAPAWQRLLTSEGGFPMKVTMADGTVALEVTKVEKKRVSDTQFRIPADYNKMDMPKRP